MSKYPDVLLANEQEGMAFIHKVSNCRNRQLLITATLHHFPIRDMRRQNEIKQLNHIVTLQITDGNLKQMALSLRKNMVNGESVGARVKIKNLRLQHADAKKPSLYGELTQLNCE